MTTNPHLRKLLGEDLSGGDKLQAGRGPLPDKSKLQTAPAAPPEMEETPGNADDGTGQPDLSAPAVQELVQLWQSGDKGAVAAKLMFTKANYIDFVNLLFVIGQEGARELGTMLDQISDTKHLQVPKAPPEYNSTLRRAVGSGTEDAII